MQARVIAPYRDIDGEDNSRLHQLKRVIPGVLGIIVLLFLAWNALDYVSADKPSISFTDSKARGNYGAVSSTHYLATQAGIEILKAGGNAADAIAVMQFMLGVVQPQSTGIGGGCFVLLFNRYLSTNLLLGNFYWRNISAAWF